MAKDILEEIVAHKRMEVERQKEQVEPSLLYNNVEKLLAADETVRRSMRESLANSASGIIALDACTARSGIVNCIVVEDEEL